MQPAPSIPKRQDGSAAPAEATPEQGAPPPPKCHIWPGHDGWTYRRGSGLVDWIYTSPHGDEYESEAEALFVASTVPPQQRDDAAEPPPKKQKQALAAARGGGGSCAAAIPAASCELAWLPGSDEEVRAAVAAGYQPWLEQSSRPALEPPQDPAVANAKYVYTLVKSLGRQSRGEDAAFEKDAEAVRRALVYPDPAGDANTAVWMIMATRPIRCGEEVLVEKYQQLESGVSHDGQRTQSSPPAANGASSGGPQKVRRPRSSKRSAGVQLEDAAQRWGQLRLSLDRTAAGPTPTDSPRYVIPPTAAAGEPCGQMHQSWGGVFGARAYAANDAGRAAAGDPSPAPLPFRKPGGDGVKLTRVEGVQAVRRACVLGKGVYISQSVVAGAGNGLFAGHAAGFERGDVITVYDGIVESPGGMIYDRHQQCFFNPKLQSEHTAPSNALWRLACGGDTAADASAKGFQSHWKDAGASPGGNSVVMGFGGWPVKFAPCGLGAGAMVNAVYGTKGRIGRDPAALAKRKAERAVRLRTQVAAAGARPGPHACRCGQAREELGLPAVRKPVGSKLACSLGWGNMGRKRRRKKKKSAAAPAAEAATAMAAMASGASGHEAAAPLP